MDDELEEENLEGEEEQGEEPGLKEDLKEIVEEEIEKKIDKEFEKRAAEKLAKKELEKKAAEKLAEKGAQQAATSSSAGGTVAAGGGTATAGSGAAAAGGTAAAGGGAAVVAPYVLIALVIVAAIAIVIYVGSLFLGAINGVSSLAGGSIFLPANHDNPEHIAIVESLVSKRDGNVSGHELVIYNAGKKDIEWKWNINAAGEKEYYHLLDIRLLKTLDYLTDRHERIKIGMLRTGSPDYLYDVVRIRDEETEEVIKEIQKETVSALHTGQAMSIVEIDRSRIPGLVHPPIQMFWQKTFAEAFTRPVWEEIAFNVGYLDRNIPVYQVISDKGAEGITDVVEKYKLDVSSGDRNMHEEAFRKIKRTLKLLDEGVFNIDTHLRTISLGLWHKLDNRTFNYFEEARNNFESLQGLIGDYEVADFDVSAAILALGQNTELIREGARFTFKATQVANMVMWNRKISVTLLDKIGCLSPADCVDPLRWWKAYESRNKIRQTIKELLQMPAKTSLGGMREKGGNGPIVADPGVDSVVKQNIAFASEDDLINASGEVTITVTDKTGSENGDVWPEDPLYNTTTFNVEFDPNQIWYDAGPPETFGTTKIEITALCFDPGLEGKDYIDDIVFDPEVSVANPIVFTADNPEPQNITMTVITGPESEPMLQDYSYFFSIKICGGQTSYKSAPGGTSSTIDTCKKNLTDGNWLYLWAGLYFGFDVDLVVKQIITFSPEDDLDNGLERLDIFPKGIEGVGVGGISFGTYGNDPESPDDPSQLAIGDGEVTYADAHFSHMPIDNGVFSKIGTSYVYRNVDADSSGWEIASHLILRTPFSILGLPGFVRDKIHDYFVGGCPADPSSISWWGNLTDCRRVSYRDFLFVAF